MLLKAVKKGAAKGSGIVYAATRRECESIAVMLTRQGIETRAYHAGLKPAVRREVQRDWSDGKVPVVTATSAFGMGIDKADCRFVIHYDMPDTLEAYYQQAGRAGRDGRTAWPLLLFRPADYRTARARLLVSWPDYETAARLYDAVCDELNLAAGSEQEQVEPLSPEAVSRRSGLPVRSVKAGVGLLERLNILQVVHRSGPRIGIRFLVHRELILESALRAGSQKGELLDRMARQFGPEAYERLYWMDLDRLLEMLQCDRETLVAVLELLGGQERLLEWRLPEDELMVRLTGPRLDRFPAGREEVEGYRSLLLEKLERMRQYAETPDCRVRFLRSYFGESPGAECGRCDRCRPDRDPPAPDVDSVERIRELLATPSTLGELLESTGWTRKRLQQVIRFLILEERVVRSGEEPARYRWSD